jgi:hypothetical protein
MQHLDMQMTVKQVTLEGEAIPYTSTHPSTTGMVPRSLQIMIDPIISKNDIHYHQEQRYHPLKAAPSSSGKGYDIAGGPSESTPAPS